jgi:hypothetical protein
VTNKTIPNGGFAAWSAWTNNNRTMSAGSSSGSPSTAPALVAQVGDGNGTLSLSYALATSSEVTSFTGTTTFDGSAANSWGAGAIFNSA